MKKPSALLLALAMMAAPAVAQQFTTVPDHTVIGRIGNGAGSGPSQAIPFSTITQYTGSGYLLPINFGAKCDGTTDDHVALQNMLNAASGGGTIFIPPNNTCITGTTLNVFSNTVITGSGRDVSSIKGIGNANPIFNINDQSNVEISNLWLRGSDSVTSWAISSIGAIRLSQDTSAVVAGSNYRFHHLKFSGFNSNYWIFVSNTSTTLSLLNPSLIDYEVSTTNADIPTDAVATNNINTFYAQFGGNAGIRTENTIIRGGRVDGAAFCFGIALFNSNYKYEISNSHLLNIGATNTVAHCTNAVPATNSYAVLVYDSNGDGNPPTGGKIEDPYILNPYSAGIYLAGDGNVGHTALSYNDFNLLVSNPHIVGQSASDTQLPRGAISINSATNIKIVGPKLYSNYNGIILSGQWTGTIDIGDITCQTAAGGAPSCIDMLPGPGTTGNTPVYSVHGGALEVDSPTSTVIRGHSNVANYYGVIDISDLKIAAADKGIDFANIYVNLRVVADTIHFSGTAATSMFDATSIANVRVFIRNSTFDLLSSITGLGLKIDSTTAHLSDIVFANRNSGSAFAYSGVSAVGTIQSMQFPNVATANQVVASSLGLAKPNFSAAAGDFVQNLSIGTGSYQTAGWINPTNGNNWIVSGTVSALTSAHLFVGNSSNVPADVALSGDATLSNAGALTLATVNSNVGSFGSATQCVSITTNGKGLITAASAVTCTPAIASVTGLGTGVATALGINTGTAGSFVVNGGALGTPSSGTLTNATGLPTTGLTGTLQAAQEPAHTGDCTNSAGSLAMSCLASNGAPFTITPQGRLTLQANTPVMTTSQSAQTTLRYDCYAGGLVPYYNGATDVLDTIASCEVTDAMVSAASAGQVVASNVYDVWWVHSGANRICLAMSTNSGGGGGWASDTGGSNTARGTGFSQLDRTTRSYTTNKNSISNCFNGATNYGPVNANQGTYLGTVWASANGQISYTFGVGAAGGTAGLLGVWNMYNRKQVVTNVSDTTSSWTYTSTTIRPWNNSTGNRISYVCGLVEDLQAVSLFTTVRLAAGSGFFDNGYALNSTSTRTSRTLETFGNSVAVQSQGAFTSSEVPGLGFNFLQAVEAGDGTNANTMIGSGAANALTLNWMM